MEKCGSFSHISFRMSYKTSKSNILMGDGGIDLIGEHRVEDYQIIPPDTLGIFVTTIGYTESSVYDILLVNISNLIKQFTLYQTIGFFGLVLDYQLWFCTLSHFFSI
uniref:Uncharacterized protein n=1 Tax=Rhizophagus irregularis (strain DAOM 181602 / DAOM 197198 / MUCL 43194) TaxID=747089 RepID=U9T7G7_RHIID